MSQFFVSIECRWHLSICTRYGQTSSRVKIKQLQGMVLDGSTPDETVEDALKVIKEDLEWFKERKEFGARCLKKQKPTAKKKAKDDE